MDESNFTVHMTHAVSQCPRMPSFHLPVCILRLLGQKWYSNETWLHKSHVPAGYVAFINKARAKPKSCSVCNLSCSLSLFLFQTNKATATANQSVQEREQGMPLCMNWEQSGITQMAQWNTGCSIVSHGVPSFTAGWGLHPATQQHKSCHFVRADDMTCTILHKPSQTASSFMNHYPAERL